ncbi:MAG: hypothetical protein MPEBLZ_01659 [Candidatus Methanoperedens nitroreducens]|uniref:Uncharacterized protein n=1 Tax=Candidatus Methanoperedens nitratireducens TaxID=1392998 RepID=A0A0P8CKX5_9EURY|nr:MAG: hypothetical protein MPEBLZ_01659 [Candidatus Methanoperedens sp. BLZ1]
MKRKSVILNVNLNKCEGKKWTENLLENKRAFYDCLKGRSISTDKLENGMKAFIKLNGGELEYKEEKYKDIQILCKVINKELRTSGEDGVDLILDRVFDEKNRINNYHLKSLGIDLQGHRGHRFIDKGEEILKIAKSTI